MLAGWSPPGVFVEVRLPGGPLLASVPADLSQVTLRGPARFVFSAELPRLPPEAGEARTP